MYTQLSHIEAACNSLLEYTSIRDMVTHRDMLVRAKRSQLIRQKNMIVEAAFTFFIAELRDKFTICNVVLQNSDQLDRKSIFV